MRRSHHAHTKTDIIISVESSFIRGAVTVSRPNAVNTDQEIYQLCDQIRALVEQEDYEGSEALIRSAMSKYPHAPQPHNLLGIVLEKKGDHLAAMKHFRAAWALDPSFAPARCNLDRFGSFTPKGKCAYDESDCPRQQESGYRIEQDAWGIKHVMKR